MMVNCLIQLILTRYHSITLRSDSFRDSQKEYIYFQDAAELNLVLPVCVQTAQGLYSELVFKLHIEEIVGQLN